MGAQEILPKPQKNKQKLLYINIKTKNDDSLKERIEGKKYSNNIFIDVNQSRNEKLKLIICQELVESK